MRHFRTVRQATGDAGGRAAMSARSLRLTRWHAHVNGVNPTVAMADWLTDSTSLTAKLTAACQRFRVQRLHQCQALCLPDEAREIGLARARHVWEREVLLRCDGRPMVFAHTVVPLAASATDWPLFSALGERSLGTTLFGDPQVRRAAMQFARLRLGHPLMRRVLAALHAANDDVENRVDGINPTLFARRCLYRRKNGLLLVTEVFLPAIAMLEQSIGAEILIPRAQTAMLAANQRKSTQINEQLKST